MVESLIFSSTGFYHISWGASIVGSKAQHLAALEESTSILVESSMLLPFGQHRDDQAFLHRCGATGNENDLVSQRHHAGTAQLVHGLLDQFLANRGAISERLGNEFNNLA